MPEKAGIPGEERTEGEQLPGDRMEENDFRLDPKAEERVRLQDVAFLAKCCSDENRLRILLCVSRNQKSVSRIVEEVRLSQPLVSHHLKELRRAFLVRVERRGPFVYYQVADKKILDIIQDMSSLARALLAGRDTFAV